MPIETIKDINISEISPQTEHSPQTPWVGGGGQWIALLWEEYWPLEEYVH